LCSQLCLVSFLFETWMSVIDHVLLIYCSLLVQKKLHKFELATLANLCPETSEEAKALIPRFVAIFRPCLNKKMCHFCFLNNSMQHWPILVIFGTQHQEETWCKWLLFSPPHLNVVATLPCEVVIWWFTTMNSHVGSKNCLRPHHHRKSNTYLILIIFISRSYVDKLKWCINSEWAALGCTLLNVLLTSRIKVQRLCSCWRRTFWAHAVIKMMWCNTFDFLRDNNCYSCLSLFS